jgi:hypothetical protein
MAAWMSGSATGDTGGRSQRTTDIAAEAWESSAPWPHMPPSITPMPVPAGLTTNETDKARQVLRLTGDLDLTTIAAIRTGMLARPYNSEALPTEVIADAAAPIPS